jgi:CheY-like chemotaxis protein
MISTRNVPMQLHPRCTENRTEGFGCAPMPADHLADVFRMDAQLKNDHLLPLDRTNLHLFGMRILIVDDSEITRRILGTIVRSRRWTVCGEAENGWSGVKKFQELKPDVVLLDLAMPDINGIEAAKQMSASDPRVSLTHDPHDDQNRTRIEHRYRSFSRSGQIQRSPDGHPKVQER